MADDTDQPVVEDAEADMAAAMEAAAEEGDAPAPAAEGEEGDDGAVGEALSQSEIDSLLGFGASEGEQKSGIEVLLDKSLQSYERLPMLEVVFDRFARNLSTSLRNFTSDTVDVSIDSITSMRFEDYLNSIPLPALLSVFQAIEWENYGIITIDSGLTYSMVDVLLGGGRVSRPMRIEGRPFTTIEQDIVKSMCKIMLDDMSTAFNPLTPATFRLERLETNPRFATISRPSSAVILISLRVDMEERGGQAEILIPYATIEPIKDLLVQMFTGESFGSDSSWEEYFTDELQDTEVELEVSLSEKTVTLKDLAQLQIGSTLITNNTPSDEIKLKCRNVDLMSVLMGSANEHIAVQVADIYQKSLKELI